MDSTNEVLQRVVMDYDENELLGGDKLTKMTKLEVFALAREIRPMSCFDSLSVGEYAIYLKSGISAAQSGCNNRARISTMDIGNPFPTLIGWPTGGGMIYAAVGQLMSQKAHLPNEVMFRDIDCVMIPKLPMNIVSRDGLLDIYWPFLSKTFEQSYESDMWTVFRRRPELSGSQGGGGRVQPVSKSFGGQPRQAPWPLKGPRR